MYSQHEHSVSKLGALSKLSKQYKHDYGHLIKFLLGPSFPPKFVFNAVDKNPTCQFEFLLSLGVSIVKTHRDDHRHPIFNTQTLLMRQKAHVHSIKK